MKMLSLLILSGFWILASGFSHAQALPDQDLSLEILPTGEKILNWTGHLDRSYFIHASPDLHEWTWAPNIEPGVEGPMSYEVDGPTAAAFFRLQYTDQTAEDLDSADFDDDGLSNNFEITARPRPGGIVGFTGLNPNIQTNPLRADTDGDGLSDKWELEHGLDPTDDGSRDPNNGPSGDPDGDGVNNVAEMSDKTDPKNAEDFEPHMISVTRYAWGNKNVVWRYAGWLPESAEHYTATTFSLYNTSGYAALLTYPAQPPENPALFETSRLNVGTSVSSYSMDREGTGDDRVAVNHKRIWIKAPAKPTAQNFYYLKIVTKTTEATPGPTITSTTTLEPIVFTIAANQTLSEPINILELSDSLPGSFCYLNCEIRPLSARGYLHKEVDKKIAVFAEKEIIEEKERQFERDQVTQRPLMQDLSELKIAQWSDAFDYSASAGWQFSYNNFKLDLDAFQIRLPNGVVPPTSGKHQVQITTLREDGTILDNGATVELDGLESQKLCLVGDEDDDLYPVDDKADGALNDHTYLAELGGTVRLTWLTPPSGNPMILGEIPVPVKKVVTVKGFILKSGLTFLSPVIGVPEANSYFERARRVLATCGVKLKYSVTDVPTNPAGVVFGGSAGNFDPPIFNVDHIEMTPESVALMEANSCKPPEDVIPVYFVGSFAATADGDILNGCSNSRSLMQSGKPSMPMRSSSIRQAQP